MSDLSSSAEAAKWAEIARKAEEKASKSQTLASRAYGQQPAASAVTQGFYCATCGELVPPDVSVAAHATSLSHLLAKESAPSQTFYLNESSKGYQLLQKIGWDDSKGLGSSQQGRLAPIASVLKQDRRGLGSAPSKVLAGSSSSGVYAADGTARVTHFPPHSEVEASRSADGLSRAEREQLLRPSKGVPSLEQVRAVARLASRERGHCAKTEADVARLASKIAADAAVAASSGSSSSASSSSAGMTARAIVKQAVRSAKEAEQQKEEQRLRRINAEVLRDDIPDHLIGLLTTSSSRGQPKKKQKR